MNCPPKPILASGVASSARVKIERRYSPKAESPIVCEHCQDYVPTDSRFCPHCGEKNQSSPWIVAVLVMADPGLAEVAQDKRKLRRVRIALPIRVRGVTADGIQFEEISRSVDVSPNGALFLLKREMKKGLRLHLSLPLSIKRVLPCWHLVSRSSSWKAGFQPVSRHFCQLISTSREIFFHILLTPHMT